MTVEQNGGTQPSTLYTVVASLYLAALLVLVASAPAEPYWYRYFVMFFLLGMEVVFLVLMIRARKAEQRQKEKPPA